MNVSCPECRSIFRLDPAKIPERGVRARCNVCGGLIEIAGAADGRDAAMPFESAPNSAQRPETDAGERVGEPVEAPAAARVDIASEEPRPEVEPAAIDRTATPAPASASITPPTTPAITGQPGGSGSAPSSASVRPPSGEAAALAPESRSRPVNPYLNNTPELRARRLARALVSDLVAYNPQKREEGLRDGTLRQLFRDEIRKSWDEYVEQVGASVAESTPHFQDALNDVLAGGRRVF